MWICSNIGFFSIVKKGKPGEWQVRARVRKDLESLIQLALMPGQKIIETTDSDYRFRVVINEVGLQSVFETLAETVTYPNFKSEIAATPGQRDKLNAYESLWGNLAELQPGR